MKRFELNPNKKLSAYSKGMQMKFSIVMALCHDPDLVLLDEPTAGLDPAARSDILNLLLEIMQADNKSVLFSTHITSDLEKIADSLTLIDHGRIIMSQAKDEVLDRYALVQIDKDMINEAIRTEMSGLRETAFGFSGLCAREKVQGLSGVKMVRPTIEDLIVHLAGDESPC